MEKLYLAEAKIVVRVPDAWRWEAEKLRYLVEEALEPVFTGNSLVEFEVRVSEVVELADETPRVACPRCGEDGGPVFSLACEHLLCTGCCTPFEEDTNLCGSCYAGDCESAARER